MSLPGCHRVTGRDGAVDLQRHTGLNAFTYFVKRPSFIGVLNIARESWKNNYVWFLACPAAWIWGCRAFSMLIRVQGFQVVQKAGC